MTIARGRPWGHAAPRPAGAPRAASDAELAALVAAGEAGPVELTGGDLWRTLGGATSSTEVQLLPVDVLRVEVDGAARIAAAHVVAKRPGRRGWWRGPLLAVMNVGAIGRWDVAPRAHPNDGRLDVVDVDGAMPVRERIQARRRLVTGSHVPHPAIRTRQCPSVDVDLETALDLLVDGVGVGRARRLRVTVVPDACTVYA